MNNKPKRVLDPLQVLIILAPVGFGVWYVIYLIIKSILALS